MLDAYTVRKAIPRIVIAVIGINLSIYLCVAAIDIVNVIGRGLAELIVDPFLKPDSFKGVGIENNATNNIAFGGIALGTILGGGVLFLPGVATGAAAGIVALIIPFAITAALITLAIVFTLVIRQGLIIFLTIISPVAIALYVLPGTEKYAKKWFDLFIRTLMVYPIIAALFALSTAMAAILLGTAGASPQTVGFAKIIATMVILLAPLVLIPFAFKLAGGAISAVMNAANGRASQTAANSVKKMRENPESFVNRSRENSRDSRIKNNLSSRALLARSNPFLRGERRAGKLSSIQQDLNLAQAQKRSKLLAWEANKDDDKFAVDLANYATGEESRRAIAAGTHALSEGAKKQSKENAEKAIRSKYSLPAGQAFTAKQREEAELLEEENYKNAQAQLYAVSAAADRTGRGTGIRAEAASSQPYIAYGLSSGEEGWKQFEQARDSIFGAEDSAEKRAFTNKFQYVAKGSGRFDMSGAVDAGEYNPDKGWNSASLYQLSNAKPADTEAHVERTKALLSSNKPTDVEAGLIRMQELKAMLPNASGGVRDKITNEMEGMEKLQDRAIQLQYMKEKGIPMGAPITEETRAEMGTYTSNLIKSASAKARTYERPDPNKIESK